MKGSNNKDNALSPGQKHDMYIKLPSPIKKKFLSYQFKLPAVSTPQQNPRKNRFRFQYKMNRAQYFDNTRTDISQHSPNSTLDHESCIYKSFRLLSRSAKIMRALSSTSGSLRHKDPEIRKLLNFDSTPSPKENSSYENFSSSINTDDTLSSTLNSSLTDSTDSNIPTVESIDENQNQTPQQNRKYIKISSNRSDVKKNMYIRSRSFYIMSLLEKEQREKPDKDVNHRIFSHSFRSFNNRPGRVITASTPRNLSQEFDQEIHDRPHTPENMINVIPESISAIKRSHKKEKLYCYEEQSSTQRMNVFAKDDDLNSKTTIESLGTDVIAETSDAESQSQKKNRSTKRSLIYNFNDEYLNIRSDCDCNMQQKTTTRTDLLESELDQIENNEMQDIDSKDCESHEENMQVGIHFVDDNDEEEKDCSKEDICNKDVSQLSLQKESSDICNVNTMSENRMASPESNSNISQNINEVVTPENHINILKHILTESIKKSHKKMKHENSKKLFKTKDLRRERELAKSEISLKDTCNDDQDIKSPTTNMICVSSPQNFEFDRPSTPENVNSSRLLLLDFNSVKKSHKKDKRSKKTSSFAECYDYEYRKRGSDSLQSSKYEEEDINRTSHRNESFGLKESPGISPKKKKKPRSMSLQTSTPKMSSAFMSLGCKDINDEFKIYTPIKKTILLTVTDYISTDEMSQEKDEAISNEIDYSRCMTPIARFKELRKNIDLASERDNAGCTGFETTSALKVVDTANLEDKNGRSTPINMSTMELLHDKNSIKKSHKKDKHSRSRRSTLEKKRSYIEDSGHVTFTNSEKILEEHTTLSLKYDVDNHDKKEICSIICEKEKDNSCKETDYNNPQPSTSRGRDSIENARSTTVSKFLNTTPPNSSNAINLIKLLHTTSIKKSHKKERDMNAQTKYIFMSQEHELSDDGSIFDEEDRLNFMDKNDNNTEITTM